MAQINKKNNEEIREVFTNFLNKHNHRKTPERFSILNEYIPLKVILILTHFMKK